MAVSRTEVTCPAAIRRTRPPTADVQHGAILKHEQRPIARGQQHPHAQQQERHAEQRTDQRDSRIKWRGICHNDGGEHQHRGEHPLDEAQKRDDAPLPQHDDGLLRVKALGRTAQEKRQPDGDHEQQHHDRRGDARCVQRLVRDEQQRKQSQRNGERQAPGEAAGPRLARRGQVLGRFKRCGRRIALLVNRRHFRRLLQHMAAMGALRDIGHLQGEPLAFQRKRLTAYRADPMRPKSASASPHQRHKGSDGNEQDGRQPPAAAGEQDGDHAGGDEERPDEQHARAALRGLLLGGDIDRVARLHTDLLEIQKEEFDQLIQVVEVVYIFAGELIVQRVIDIQPCALGADVHPPVEPGKRQAAAGKLCRIGGMLGVQALIELAQIGFLIHEVVSFERRALCIQEIALI